MSAIEIVKWAGPPDQLSALVWYEDRVKNPPELSEGFIASASMKEGVSQI